MDGEISRIELGNELDLHHFHPGDVKELVHDFIGNARQRGAGEVRIVHGKGMSVIKSIVISELEKDANILSFREEPGNWGAMLVRIKPGV